MPFSVQRSLRGIAAVLVAAAWVDCGSGSRGDGGLSRQASDASARCDRGTVPVGELCDGLDNDCDGATDDGFSSLGSACLSGLGACAREGTQVCSADGLATVCNATEGEPSDEQCDNTDNDCDGATDESCDDDRDGYCDAAMIVTGIPDVCPLTTGPALYDCSDSDASVNPGASEICGDAGDQDCDGNNDNGCECPIPDFDLDGHASVPCGGTDCDDANGAINAAATERCDGVDNNCDGSLDEGFDADGDGYTTCGTIRPGGGMDPSRADCDDADAQRRPFGCELCATASGVVVCGASNDRGNDVDDDCDGYVDETCAPCDVLDVDGDGISACEGDCAPTDGEVSPGAAERCDGKDTDCNRTTQSNCGRGERCNWPGYPASTDPSPDLCGDQGLCVESLAGSGRGTGEFTCTGFCNSSPAGSGAGDGCADNETCSAQLTPTANLHACAVNSEIGALATGQTCSAHAECRSDDCLRDERFTGTVKYCTDFCGSDAYCPEGTLCQISGSRTGATTAGCRRTTPQQTRDVGSDCSGSFDHAYCRGGLGACVALGNGWICTKACCSNSDCPAGYTCSLQGNDAPSPVDGYDTVPICYPYAGAGSHERAAGEGCTASSDCASDFCEFTLGVCVDICCNDAGCPAGLRCENAAVARGLDRLSFARVCLNLTLTQALQRR